MASIVWGQTEGEHGKHTRRGGKHGKAARHRDQIEERVYLTEVVAEGGVEVPADPLRTHLREGRSMIGRRGQGCTQQGGSAQQGRVNHAVPSHLHYGRLDPEAFDLQAGRRVRPSVEEGGRARPVGRHEVDKGRLLRIRATVGVGLLGSQG